MLIYCITTKPSFVYPFILLKLRYPGLKYCSNSWRSKSAQVLPKDRCSFIAHPGLGYLVHQVDIFCINNNT